jgi:cytochrome c55X
MPERRRRTGALLLLAACLASAPAAEPPSAERQAELLYRLRQDCGSCHGMTLKGGLGPSLLPEALAGKDSESLAYIILHGVPGTPMPPWDIELSPDEAAWLALQLKSGVRP